MAWFKNIINNIFEKNASKQEIKNKALQQIQQRLDPSAIASEFIRDMSNTDPSFATGQWTNMIMDASRSLDTLSNVLSNFNTGDEMTELPAPPEQAMDLTPLESPGVTPEQEGRVSPEDVEDAATEEGKVSEEGIVGEEAVLTQQLDAPPNFEDRVTSDPTLLETFELPTSQIKTVRNKLATINKKLRDMYYPEIKIEFVGEAYNKPVRYQNRTVQEPYIQVKISGTLPSPSEEIAIKRQEPVTQRGGTVRMKTVGTEPKGVRLIAKIIHKELDEATQNKYLQTLDMNSPLRHVIEDSRAKGETPFFNVVEPLEGAPPIEGKFWYSSPQECMACKVKKAGLTARKATYIGVVVPPEQMVPKTADIGGRETILTRKIKNRKTGNLEEQPIKVIPDDLITQAPQEQFGGKCIDPFDAVKTITALKNWVKNTKKAKQEYEKKKSKKKHKGGGWGRSSLPTEQLLAVAVNLMRDTYYRNSHENVARRLGGKTYAYRRSLKTEDSTGYNLNRSRFAPKITEEDKQTASDVASWWRGKLGGLDVENKDRNKITLSVVPDIGTQPANMRDVAEMVKIYLDYNDITLEPVPEEPVVEKPVETI